MATKRVADMTTEELAAHRARRREYARRYREGMTPEERAADLARKNEIARRRYEANRTKINKRRAERWREMGNRSRV